MMDFGRSTTTKLVVLIALFALIVAGFALYRPAFFQPTLASTVLQFSSMLALVALGQALVILAGGAGIDLSVGGVVSLSVILTMQCVAAGTPPILIPLLPVALGIALGAINGLLVTRVQILPLIATLGTLFVYGGAAMAITGGATLSGTPRWLTPFGRGLAAGIPWHFLTLVLPAYAVVAVLLTYTSWGRWIYAMGYNERAAQLVGVNVKRVRFLAYCVSGGFSGLAALISLAWFGAARPNIGQNLELESLAAALLGGIAITGGAGGVLGVLVAVLMIVTLKTGLQFINVSTVWQVGVVGALLIVVLVVDLIPFRRRS
jgi:ribose transport system permease protein/rhamnose transport system permease protein